MLFFKGLFLNVFIMLDREFWIAESPQALFTHLFRRPLVLSVSFHIYQTTMTRISTRHIRSVPFKPRAAIKQPLHQQAGVKRRLEGKESGWVKLRLMGYSSTADPGPNHARPIHFSGLDRDDVTKFN